MNLRPSQVILDPENPRLPDGTSSDREAINRLLADGAEQLINLARDMAREGEANPTELPIAVKSGSKYLILEGNRRFAALKLLKDPALADDEAHQRAFRRAAALGTPPKSIYTHVASSRDGADHWIILRHTGDNNGVGVKRWSASQTATHRRRNNVAVDAGTLRSIAIADDLERTYATDDELVNLVRDVRKGKLTNIGRFFSPDVMNTLLLSIQVDDSGTRSLWARHSAEQLRDFFAWAFEYILRHSVDAYKNADIRSEALALAVHVRPSLADATEKPQQFGDAVASPDQAPEESSSTDLGLSEEESEDAEPADDTDAVDTGAESEDSQPTEEQKQAQKRRKDEARPEKYLLQRLRLPNHPERIQRLLKECRSIELSEWPGVACVMIRVIVELSVSSEQALSLTGARESDSLKAKIISMLKYLDPEIENPRKRDKKLAQAYLEVSELGIQYMNGFVHNPALIPDEHLARRYSQAFRSLLERVDAEL